MKLGIIQGITPLLLISLLLFPLVSSATTLTANQRITIESELQTLEAELQTYLDSTCVTGKSWQNGSCEWTASSTAAIAAAQEQTQKAEQFEEQGVQAGLQNQIVNLQQEYQQYQTDIQNLETSVQRACTLNTVNPPVSQGLAGVSEQESATSCETLSEISTPEIQADEQQESNLQTQIDEDRAELN